MGKIYPEGMALTWRKLLPGKSYSNAENETRQVEAIGDYETLDKMRNGILTPVLKPGEWFGSGLEDDKHNVIIPSKYAIRTVSLTKEEGYGDRRFIGVLRLTLVYCATETSPFETTVDVDFREVTKSLITHPDIQGDGIALKQIRLWNETPEARRVSYSGSSIAFWYYDPQSPTPDVLIPVGNPNAYKYLFALSKGIESYNVYLPVVQRVTKRIKLPRSSGTDANITIEYDDDLGKFVSSSSVPECPSGFTKGLWFKNVDRYSRASDGVWTRTEEWTFTNDTKHDWIYEHED